MNDEPKTCPWEDPEYMLPIEKPCPVCGMTGFDWPLVEDKCVGMATPDTPAVCEGKND